VDFVCNDISIQANYYTASRGFSATSELLVVQERATVSHLYSSSNNSLFWRISYSEIA